MSNKWFGFTMTGFHYNLQIYKNGFIKKGDKKGL